MGKFVAWQVVAAWQVVSLMKNEQQSPSRPALYFSQLLSSTPTSWSRKVKNAKHRPKTCNTTMLRDNRGFVNLVFRVPYRTLDDSNRSVARWLFFVPFRSFSLQIYLRWLESHFSKCNESKLSWIVDRNRLTVTQVTQTDYTYLGSAIEHYWLGRVQSFKTSFNKFPSLSWNTKARKYPGNDTLRVEVPSIFLEKSGRGRWRNNFVVLSSTFYRLLNF